jgi:hypothetical protein
VYTGRSKNHTIDQFIAKMNEAFTQLATADDPYSENAKVLLLLEKIKPVAELGSVFAHICGDQVLLNDFTSAVTYMQSCVSIYKSTETPTTRTVSATTTSSTDYSDLKQSYSAAEWKKLSQDTKKRVVQRNKENGTSKGKSTTSLKTMKRKVKALTKENEKLKGDGKEDDDDDSDSNPTVTTGKKGGKK